MACSWLTNRLENENRLQTTLLQWAITNAKPQAASKKSVTKCGWGLASDMGYGL